MKRLSRNSYKIVWRFQLPQSQPRKISLIRRTWKFKFHSIGAEPISCKILSFFTYRHLLIVVFFNNT
nr:MAG TPA: hypothetical protein [Caudoviricetes sp.]